MKEVQQQRRKTARRGSFNSNGEVKEHRHENSKTQTIRPHRRLIFPLFSLHYHWLLFTWFEGRKQTWSSLLLLVHCSLWVTSRPLRLDRWIGKENTRFIGSDMFELSRSFCKRASRCQWHVFPQSHVMGKSVRLCKGTSRSHGGKWISGNGGRASFFL